MQTKSRHRHLIGCFCAFAIAMAFSLQFTDRAAARDPLLILGKQTLFQRILTRPNAPLFTQPGEEDAAETFPPFEIFYVYGEQTVNGEEFIEVGRSLEIGVEGWMPRNRTIEWKQSIVLGFNNPANRNRVLIFKSQEELIDTLRQEDVQSRLDRLRADAIANRLSPNSPVISIEPEEYIDIENEFYILPIIESQSIRLPTHIPAKLLRIASVSRNSDQGVQVSREGALRNFRIGVTFVIDTTKSMGPYVDEVRRAVSLLRDRIAGNPEAERFRFGLVAFRDSTDLAPELEYVTDVLLPLSETSSADKFLTAIGDISIAEVNSSGYNEDSIGGIQAALDEMDWNTFGGRYIILITDAGPRRPGEDAVAGDLAPTQLQSLLQREKIALFTLHLKSEEGQFDHEYAEIAYRAMSLFGSDTLYFPIEDADPVVFGQKIDQLATNLEQLVSSTIEGHIREVEENEPGNISSSASRVGRAMALAYLGEITGTQAPDVFDGWLTNRDPMNAGEFPLTPYVLMSRNELSTLRDVIERAIDLGVAASQQGTSVNFFNQLREAVALISRRPEATQEAGTLGDLLGEYLEDLPYNSEVTNITAEDWRDMSPIGERQLLDTLRSKVIALERIYRDTARWFPIRPDAPDGEYVTVVPLSLMP